LSALNEGEEATGAIRSPELAATFEAVLELAALGFHGPTTDGDFLLSQIVVMNVVFMREEVLGRLFDDFSGMNVFRRGLNHEILEGFDNPLVRKVMGGKSPGARAIELIRGTKLADVAVRRQLAAGGIAAIEASQDPLILLARLVDGPARKVRTRYEQQVEEPQRWAYGKLAGARFALFGTETYPDATFTLRLAFGLVKGYREGGRQVPPWTTLGGAYRRAEQHGSKEPFALPQSWLDHKARLNLDTPMDFVCTADIIGGNSGSPVVNRNGELVGIIFDGNLPSLVWDYVFAEEDGRAIAVHGSAILEALRNIYGAAQLVDEMTQASPRQ